MVQVGDRVKCLVVSDGNSTTLEKEGTIIDIVSGRGNHFVPVIEFDVPIKGGHGGGIDNSSGGKPKHCWNCWDYSESIKYFELVKAMSTQEKVLAKIKKLDEDYKLRMKGKVCA